MKEGGNAIDAAVATAFALAVTWPSAGNIGGGGFMVYTDKNAQSTTLDFREMAPYAATENMFLDSEGKLIKDLNRIGVLSAGTPGTVAGLYYAHKKYGKLPWNKLVEPSIQLATKGIPFSYVLNEHANQQKEVWKKYPSTAKVMLKNGADVYEFGETWKQPDLAKTLTRIRDNGQDGFYKGETAKKLTDFIKAQGGLITQKDLDEYQVVERKPITGSYRGYSIVTMGPPSSGGIALIEMLNILEGYELNTLGYKSADYVHVLTESMRRAFADRAEFLGDPEFNENMPTDRLTSKEYARRLRGQIKMDRASVSDSSKFGQVYDGGQNTTHLSVMDSEGNAVSMTYTIEQSYGSQVIADGLGFFLNDEMGDFNPVPNVTNRQGQIGTKPNLISPGKRMLSSMTPTILLKDNKVVMVIGAPGGRTIINTVLQVIVNVVDFNMNIAQAIEEPRIHHQWLPPRLAFQWLSLSKDTQVKLKERGHELLELQPVQTLGGAMGIMTDTKKGYIHGAADSRSQDGGASGY